MFEDSMTQQLSFIMRLGLMEFDYFLRSLFWISVSLRVVLVWFCQGEKIEGTESWWKSKHKGLLFGPVIEKLNLNSLQTYLVICLNKIGNSVLSAVQILWHCSNYKPIEITHLGSIVLQELIEWITAWLNFLLNCLWYVLVILLHLKIRALTHHIRLRH